MSHPTSISNRHHMVQHSRMDSPIKVTQLQTRLIGILKVLHSPYITQEVAAGEVMEIVGVTSHLNLEDQADVGMNLSLYHLQHRTVSPIQVILLLFIIPLLHFLIQALRRRRLRRVKMVVSANSHDVAEAAGTGMVLVEGVGITVAVPITMGNPVRTIIPSPIRITTNPRPTHR